MSLLELVFGALGVALLASLALALRHRDRAGSRVAFALRLSAVAATTVVAAVMAWLGAESDTGAYTLPLVGVPLVAALLVLGFSLTGRPSGGVTWVAAVVMLGWSLLTAFGGGILFLLPAAMMLVAAVASTPGRTKPAPAVGDA